MTEIVRVNAVVRTKRLVDVVVHSGRAEHRVGHLPGEGWFCVCARGKGCAQIDYVRKITPEMEK